MFGPRHLVRLDLILRELRSLPRGARHLDAACGLGQLAARVEAMGHRSFGVDGEFAAALYTKRNAKVPAVVADMSHLPFKEAAFDAVTSGETLEHLDDDRSAARELVRVTRGGGRCVITVPALQSLWTASDVYYEHRRRYSRAELVGLIESAGFEVKRAIYWGFPVTLAYDTLFILPMNKRRARRGSLPMVASAGRSTLLVSLVRAFLSIDRLFQFVPFGPGLLLVASRSRSSDVSGSR